MSHAPEPIARCVICVAAAACFADQRCPLLIRPHVALACRDDAPVVEFDCEGCGDHVYAFGLETKPLHGFCAVCAHLCEFVPDPEAMMRIRQMTQGLNLRRPPQPVRRAGSTHGKDD